MLPPLANTYTCFTAGCTSSCTGEFLVEYWNRGLFSFPEASSLSSRIMAGCKIKWQSFQVSAIISLELKWYFSINMPVPAATSEKRSLIWSMSIKQINIPLCHYVIPRGPLLHWLLHIFWLIPSRTWGQLRVYLTLLQYNMLYCIKWFVTFMTYSMYSMGTMLYSQHIIRRVTLHSPLYWMISWACFILLKQAQNNVLQVESKSSVTNMSPPQALALHLLDLWCQM